MTKRSLLSPRQRMISLMYLIFIAMIAIRVPSEVLDSFEWIDRSIESSIRNIEERNRDIYIEICSYADRDEEAYHWFTHSAEVVKEADMLSEYLEEVKYMIVRQADGWNADISNIRNRDQVEAVSRVMLAPMKGEAGRLKKELDDYRECLKSKVDDPKLLELLDKEINTTVLNHGITLGSWEADLFENRPVAAVISLLTKWQWNARFVEGEVLLYIRNQIVKPGFPQYEPLVITPQQDLIPREAFVSSVRMNVLYAGYPNELRIAISGSSLSELEVSITNGTIIPAANGNWIARPELPGAESVVTVRSRKDSSVAFEIPFRVIPLPPPVAFISWQDEEGMSCFFTGGRIKKEHLLQVTELNAHYPDNLLDTEFEVSSFSMIWEDSFGNRMKEEATGSSFTNRQRDYLQQATRGKKVFISGITVLGENDQQFDLPTMEIMID